MMNHRGELKESLSDGGSSPSTRQRLWVAGYDDASTTDYLEDRKTKEEMVTVSMFL
ncbi:hypothetical protein AALO_G00233780 [Alosa alosa]|uniref:Uncharacterized protein n=1 Tax=Alosa alosa TaxID=278164 RepID=A0AAV6FZG6_9TELE|nr:hypothetical protein AALO_G00233780 [Alosa alosa]